MVGTKHRRGVLLSVVAGLALLLAACGGGGSSSSSGGGGGSGGLTDLGKQLPASIQQS